MKLKLIVLLILFSCSNVQRIRFVCNCEQREKIENFLINTIEKANNKSDEEMEDVIMELRRSAIIIHCDQRTFIFDHNYFILPEEINALDSCEVIML